MYCIIIHFAGMYGVYIVQDSRVTKHIYLLQLRRYLGKYDLLSIQDKLSLVDDLKQHHISGLKLGKSYSLINI